MKKLFFSIVCSLMFCSIYSFGQDNNQEMDPQTKAWMDYMTPGETHKMLGSAAGEWTNKVTFWMAPETEPMVTEGTTTIEMILGGRYQKSTSHGDMMGMPFEGIGITAYDNATKEFCNVWIDNMGTGIMTCKGKYNEATKKVELEGTYVDPMTAAEQPFKETFQIVDKDHHVLEMFTKVNGQEFKSMMVEYTRKTGM